MAIPADLPIPPELAVDDEPITDFDLDEYLVAREAFSGTYTDEMVESQLEHREAHRWQIDSDALAEWALRKLAVAQEEVARLDEQAADWRRRIDAWFEQAAGPHRRRIAWATERLEDYALRLREHGGVATLTLPSGVIKTTVTKPAIEVEDDAAVAALLQRAISGAESQAWKDALEAQVEGDTEADRHAYFQSLFRYTPKVYVGPLRKVARIDERVLEHRARVVLGVCGHVRMITLESHDDPAVPVRGEMIPCPVCPQDSLEGDAVRPVDDVEVEQVVELIVVGPDGEPIPGAQVRPGGVTPKVEVR